MAEIGLCHLCSLPRLVNYCGICGHWFCAECRRKWFKRGWAAVKEVVGGVKGKGECWCGPTKQS